MRTEILRAIERSLPGHRKMLAEKTSHLWRQLNSFSQYDEDLILTRLTEKIKCPHKFVEFGFAPLENNCLRLALKEGWEGIFIDPIKSHVRLVNDTAKHFPNVKIKAVEAFLTVENFHEVIDPEPSIGLMSIDVDGNDYWLWERSFIRPEIVAVEFNPVFGDWSITVPYSPDFNRFRAHKTFLYHGASLSALEKLAKKRKYSLVACSTFGANAFFVRDDVLNVPSIRAKDADLSHVLVRGKKPLEHWDSIKNMPYVEIV